MKCVLLYSKRHFTPGVDSDLNGSSAGVISKEIYETLASIENLELYYYDAFNLEEWKSVNSDILVSIIDSFDLAYWYFKPKIAILIAVNQHPLDRLLTTADTSKKGLPKNVLSGSDGYLQNANGLRKANAVIYVGNEITALSFKNYLPETKLYQAYYLPHSGIRGSHQETKESRSVLVLMSSIGFRKGFDRFYEALNLDSEALSKFKFNIVGSPEGDFWEEKVLELTYKYPNVNFQGWISNLSPEFQSILNNSDYAIFPTREEGMVGSLLECIASGILCLHTQNSGLDNSLDFLKLPSAGNLNLANKLNFIDGLDDSQKNSVREIQKIDLNFQIKMSESVGNALMLAINEANTNKEIWSKFVFKYYVSYLRVYAKVPSGILFRRFKFISRNSLRNRLYLRHLKLLKFSITFKNLIS
jgi:glycosyltransferase involved in cell wall biosynthesis